MNYWLHRISYLMNISYPILEKGFISIGFSDFANDDFIENDFAEDWDYFNECFDNEWGKRPRSRFSLWKFINEMKKDDFVIVPSWNNFSIYKIEGNTFELFNSVDSLENTTDWNGNTLHKNREGIFCLNEQPIDIGFVRKVTLVAKDIDRSQYADSLLTARLKIRETTASISDLKESVDRSIERFKFEKPINIYAELQEATKDIWHSKIIESLNPDKFERLIKAYFIKCGATNVYIPAKNETDKNGDADVIAIFESIKLIIASQVKFHQGQTDSWALEQINDFAESNLNAGDGYNRIYWVISSADEFSEKCFEEAKLHNVNLIDGKEFTRMLMDIGIEKLHEMIG